MNNDFQHSVEAVDLDLATSWITLSAEVRTLADNLKTKAAGTALSAEAERLSHQASRLCDHVERIHEDVTSLLENIETRIPDRGLADSGSELDCGEVEQEKIQIQRENHELKSDFKDILKALFMWVDDPEERVREKKVSR